MRMPSLSYEERERIACAKHLNIRPLNIENIEIGDKDAFGHRTLIVTARINNLLTNVEIKTVRGASGFVNCLCPPSKNPPFETGDRVTRKKPRGYPSDSGVVASTRIRRLGYFDWWVIYLEDDCSRYDGYDASEYELVAGD